MSNRQQADGDGVATFVLMLGFGGGDTYINRVFRTFRHRKPIIYNTFLGVTADSECDFLPICADKSS